MKILSSILCSFILFPASLFSAEDPAEPASPRPPSYEDAIKTNLPPPAATGPSAPSAAPLPAPVVLVPLQQARTPGEIAKDIIEQIRNKVLAFPNNISAQQAAEQLKAEIDALLLNDNQARVALRKLRQELAKPLDDYYVHAGWHSTESEAHCAPCPKPPPDVSTLRLAYAACFAYCGNYCCDKKTIESDGNRRNRCWNLGAILGIAYRCHTIGCACSGPCCTCLGQAACHTLGTCLYACAGGCAITLIPPAGAFVLGMAALLVSEILIIPLTKVCGRQVTTETLFKVPELPNKSPKEAALTALDSIEVLLLDVVSHEAITQAVGHLSSEVPGLGTMQYYPKSPL